MDQPNEITLHDVIAHISAMDQSLSEKIDSVEKSLSTKIEANAAKIDASAEKIEQLQRDVSTLQEDCNSFFGDIADYVTVERPHVRVRLDRLEQHTGLAPIPIPTSVE